MIVALTPAVAAAGAIGGSAMGAGFGLGYGTSLSVGYAYGQQLTWKMQAKNNAMRYLYEQMYRVYTDYYVQGARYNLGLRSQFDQSYG